MSKINDRQESFVPGCRGPKTSSGTYICTHWNSAKQGFWTPLLHMDHAYSNCASFYTAISSCNNYQLWASSAYGCSKSSLSSSYLIKSNLIRFYIFFLIWFRLLCMWLHNRAFDCSESSRFSSLASLTGSPDAKDQTLQRSISIALCKQTLITLLGTIRNKNMVGQRAGQ